MPDSATLYSSLEFAGFGLQNWMKFPFLASIADMVSNLGFVLLPVWRGGFCAHIHPAPQSPHPILSLGKLLHVCPV